MGTWENFFGGYVVTVFTSRKCKITAGYVRLRKLGRVRCGERFSNDDDDS